MKQLAPPQRTKLIAILGMLGSEFDGERAAAALKASELVKANGLTWHDLLSPQPQQPQDPAVANWRAMLHDCMASNLMTEWERGFLQSLMGFRKISPKQMAVLVRVHSKVTEAKS